MALVRRLQAIPAIVGLALVAGGAGAAPVSRTDAAIGPTIITIGQGTDGNTTFLVHGYAVANASMQSLGGVASSDLNFRVGGYCLDRAEAALIPTGVAGNTTAWSYYFTGIIVSLDEDTPKGSCRYTVHVSYTLSIAGAVTINQMEYSVYLSGSPEPESTGGVLTLLP